MKLKKVWEYNICGEYFDEARQQQIYKAWNIIADESPVTAWPKIFEILGKEKDFAEIRRLQNVSAYPKELLVL